MKKTLFLALAALAAAGSAQAKGFDDFSFGNDNNGFSVIGQFGLNVSNLRTNDLLPDLMGDTDPKAGFNAGVHFEYILPQCYGVYINGGLEYSMKGAKHRPFDVFFEDGVGANGVARPMYLSIPVHIGYRYNILDDLGVYADLGPYFALGTNGKHIYKYDDYRANSKQGFFNGGVLGDLDPNNHAQYYETKRGDIGFGFRVGAEYAKHYNLIISCDWGLTDMLSQEQKNLLVKIPGIHKPSMKNFAAGITFGYRF